MVSASPSARTSICTRLAVCARNTAACPAELPPPTTTTSSSRHSCASMNGAPYYTRAPSNQYIAQLAVRLHERKQLFAINFDHFAWFSRSYLDEPPMPREQVYFTGEHTRLIDCHEFLIRAGRSNEFDLPLSDDIEPCGALAHFNKSFTRLHMPHMTMPGDSRDLRPGQPREYLDGARRIVRWDYWSFIVHQISLSIAISSIIHTKIKIVRPLSQIDCFITFMTNKFS